MSRNWKNGVCPTNVAKGDSRQLEQGLVRVVLHKVFV